MLRSHVLLSGVGAVLTDDAGRQLYNDQQTALDAAEQVYRQAGQHRMTDRDRLSDAIGEYLRVMRVLDDADNARREGADHAG